MARIKHVIFLAIAIFLGLFAALGTFEVVFRMLPTSDSAVIQPVSSNAPYRHLLPNTTRHLSRGRFFQIQTEKHINNYGFFSDTDYVRNNPRPTIAVIGDSFVEAVHVSNLQSIQGQLQEQMGPAYDVYAIGAAGAPLSQYLAYARFASDEFDPDIFVFVIIYNDYDESVIRASSPPGFHYFSFDEGTPREILIDYSPSRVRSALQHSALARYLYINAGADALLANLFSRRDAKNVDLADRLDLSKKAVDYFLDELRPVTANKRVVFLIDGDRRSIYDPTLKIDEFLWTMNLYFQSAATTRGFECVDLYPFFKARHEESGARFDFPSDYHWNSLGHAIAASAAHDWIVAR